MIKARPFHAVLLAAACCSAVLAAPAAEAQKKPGEKKAVVSDAGTFDASGRYVLSEAELKLECKKLSSRVSLRLLQLRAELADKSQPTVAAQTLQQVTGPALKLMYGGASSYGTDRGSQLRRDRAVIEAYNQQLTAKSCQPYDTEAELKKTPADPSPSPIPKSAVKK